MTDKIPGSLRSSHSRGGEGGVLNKEAKNYTFIKK